MSNILDRKVLLVNADWQAIGTITVKKAFEDMNSSRKPKKGIKIEYALDKDGKPDYDKPTEILPLAWSEWSTLAPRPYDEDSMRTSKSEFRVPTVVIVGSNYRKMPVKTFRPTKRNIYNHYGGRCIWGGEVVPYKDATLEHMHPRSRGGDNSWKNLAIAAPKPNMEKADRTPEEYGVKPKYKLSEPKPVTADLLVKATHPDWVWFIEKGDKRHDN